MANLHDLISNISVATGPDLTRLKHHLHEADSLALRYVSLFHYIDYDVCYALFHCSHTVIDVDVLKSKFFGLYLVI